MLYDALTPLFDQVSAKDVTKDFKAEPLWNVAERRRYARSTLDAASGSSATRSTCRTCSARPRRTSSTASGWAVAEDRGLLMELARYPGRLACLDAPGFNAFSVALSGKQFKPSQRRPSRSSQRTHTARRPGRQAGARGHRCLRRGRQRAAQGREPRRLHRGRGSTWSRPPACSARASERAAATRHAAPSSSRALQAKLGATKGLSVFNDLREAERPGGADDARQGVPVRPADGRRARRGQRDRRRRERCSAARVAAARCRTRSSSRRSGRRPVIRSWSPGRSSATSIPSSSGRSTWRAAASRCAAARWPASRTS